MFVVKSFEDYLKNIKCLSNSRPNWFRVFGTESYIFLDWIECDEENKIYEVKYMIQVPDKRYVFERWITTKSAWVTFEEFFETLPDDAKLEFAFHLNSFK
jgi:hypothetical protein